MKCKYCNKELPEIINSKQDICGCEKSKINWELNLDIQHYKKLLIDLNKRLKDLDEQHDANGKNNEK